MPTLDIREANAFTVINNEDKHARGQRNVNIVKPLQRDDDSDVTKTGKEQVTDRMVAVTPQTILDPKFSRALDFKLRRLKEKEILEANLRRPTRQRRRAGALAASNPSINWKDSTPPKKMLSQSQPRIDIISCNGESSKFSRNDKSPVCKSRSRVSGISEGEKPRFVTTVKTGQFLLPPPDVACLLGLQTLYPPQEREKIVYSYASKPKAVATRTKRASETKTEKVPNGLPTNINNTRPKNASEAFKGVRALIAGVAWVKHLLEQSDNVGSMATGVAGSQGYTNLMHDKRVVRGSTFSSHPHAAGDGIESNAARAARTRRRTLARRAALARLRPGTPPPAPGRRHHPIQTEYYLEELFDKGVEMEVGVQTDLFVDRPATPIYVPAKTGADASTQIYPGDLFDFDLEVQPILEVLVGKTTEQALAEVAQEEELATLREQQRRYRELRDAELAERQRLAAQDERLQKEKERRIAEARAAAVSGREARSRVAAAALVHGYVADLLPAVLAGLRDGGYLVRRMQQGVEDEFMPWLVQEVSQELESIITSRDVITEIVRDVVEARAELYGAVGETEAQRVSPPESITPMSELEGEVEAEMNEE
ncbi:radial spoke head protein 3 homolog [Danaus plexippus]|uniref:radial spoke head protein 3 homolog n=1 Tax=Danaus plexippus TaxID=13037 RepID=UPI002AB2FA83|nr:radial spoke head protein 3 homolog [Danaus plexippus]